MALPCTEECSDNTFLKEMERVGQLPLQKMYKLYFRLDRPESSSVRCALRRTRIANESSNLILSKSHVIPAILQNMMHFADSAFKVNETNNH